MPETNSNSAAPFDLQGLNEMYGQETVAELLAMSLDEGSGLIAQIDKGIEERSTRTIMEAAHQLKGLASTMTINKLANLSLQLETAARQEQWQSIPDAQSQLSGEFARVSDYIRSVLSTLQA